MNKQVSAKIWVTVLKKSLLPFLVCGLILTAFLFIDERYGLRQNKYLLKSFKLLITLTITFWVSRVSIALFNWYAENIALKTKTDLDDKFIPLFKRLAVTIVWSLGLIVALGMLGVNINALVATLGVSSLAIALAAQDTISNIIAGFLIMVDRPFSIGDEVKLPSGERVKVLDIGIRRSKFLSEEKAFIIMPNLELSKSKITNYSQAKNLKLNA